MQRYTGSTSLTIGKLITLAIIMLGSGALANHGDGRSNKLQDGIARFQSAYQQWDSTGFWNATRSFREAARMDPRSAKARYGLGAAHFHRMLQLQSCPPSPKRNKAAAGDMQHAIEALESALSLDPNHAESHAILATLYGMKINGSFVCAIRYGSKVQKHHKLALKHGVQNPRVHYLIGAGRLHTADNDGDRLEALKSLLLASSLYLAEHKEPQHSPDIDWGHDACLCFIGDIFTKMHKPAKAKDYYAKALKARPTNHKAKVALSKLSK